MRIGIRVSGGWDMVGAKVGEERCGKSQSSVQDGKTERVETFRASPSSTPPPRLAMSLLRIPSPFDAHVHLRQGSLMRLVTPHVHQGGVNLAFVMPNLIPPLTTPTAALAYHKQLSTLEPNVKFLPSMYLTTSLTPASIREAKLGGVVGVKSYPRGVTTNSGEGVGMEGYSVFDEVFAEMERVDMVLNLHGEVPSDIDGNVSSPRPLLSCLSLSALPLVPPSRRSIPPGQETLWRAGGGAMEAECRRA